MTTRPARQFPSPSFVVGTDLVSVQDIADSLTAFGARYLERVYTADEIAYCMREPSQTALRLAARFAAKEATFKLLNASDRGFAWTSIGVARSDSGTLELILMGEALRAAESQGYTAFSVSFTHERDYASAVVLGQREAVARDATATDI